ncbi:YlqD family protein [Priestia megaterium]|uniref:YlqD family protein n=1 Tax=Priestia megaterium TaxID=1404 RepID=UPI003D0856BD
MNIIQKVVVKQVLTEASKQDLENRFINRRQALEKEMEQLKFQLKHMEKANKGSSLLHSQFEKEKSARLEKIEVLNFQLTQLEKLPLGSELVETELDALVEVKIGDDWEKIKESKTIIIKDSKVVEIR